MIYAARTFLEFSNWNFNNYCFLLSPREVRSSCFLGGRLRAIASSTYRARRSYPREQAAEDAFTRLLQIIYISKANVGWAKCAPYSKPRLKRKTRRTHMHQNAVHGCRRLSFLQSTIPFSCANLPNPCGAHGLLSSVALYIAAWQAGAAPNRIGIWKFRASLRTSVLSSSLQSACAWLRRSVWVLLCGENPQREKQQVFFFCLFSLLLIGCSLFCIRFYFVYLRKVIEILGEKRGISDIVFAMLASSFLSCSFPKNYVLTKFSA